MSHRHDRSFDCVHGDHTWKLKRATDNAKKEYLENIGNEIMELQRTGRYDLMYMKTKELGWQETQGIQNIGIEDFRRKRIVELSQVLKIW